MALVFQLVASLLPWLRHRSGTGADGAQGCHRPGTGAGGETRRGHKFDVGSRTYGFNASAFQAIAASA